LDQVVMHDEIEKIPLTQHPDFEQVCTSITHSRRCWNTCIGRTNILFSHLRLTDMDLARVFTALGQMAADLNLSQILKCFILQPLLCLVALLFCALHLLIKFQK
jgi:hypothetical protein